MSFGIKMSILEKTRFPFDFFSCFYAQKLFFIRFIYLVQTPQVSESACYRLHALRSGAPPKSLCRPSSGGSYLIFPQIPRILPQYYSIDQFHNRKRIQNKKMQHIFKILCKPNKSWVQVLPGCHKYGNYDIIKQYQEKDHFILKPDMAPVALCIFYNHIICV